MRVRWQYEWAVPREHWIAGLRGRLTNPERFATRDLLVYAERFGVTIDIEERSALAIALNVPYEDERDTAELVQVAMQRGFRFE